MRYTLKAGAPCEDGVLAIFETDNPPLVGETVKWRGGLFVGVDSSSAVFVGPIHTRPRKLSGTLLGCWEPDDAAGLKWTNYEDGKPT
jgi:hypothetical protein